MVKSGRVFSQGKKNRFEQMSTTLVRDSVQGMGLEVEGWCDWLVAVVVVD